MNTFTHAVLPPLLSQVPYLLRAMNFRGVLTIQ